MYRAKKGINLQKSILVFIIHEVGHFSNRKISIET